MNTLLLHPTDILFFRDGRPMSGSLAGHGAAWPLPTVLNGALHAALWRADLDNVHAHRSGRSSVRPDNAGRDRKFGSLVTAGPFPVRVENEKGEPIDPVWFFPRPADAQDTDTTAVTLQPTPLTGPSSLPAPLSLAVANTLPPTKDKPAAWWSTSAWQTYLAGQEKVVRVLPPANPHSADKSSCVPNSNPANPEGKAGPLSFASDTDFSDTEHTIGIGIDPGTGTQNGAQFYSAHYLRLREGWRMGAFAEAKDKVNGNSAEKRDLIQTLFPNSGTETPVIIGGQQRLCTVARHSNVESLPLPHGSEISGTRIKWVLLTPAVWPEIGEHKGGWLPSWVDHDGNVQLLDGPGKNAARRHKVVEGKRIQATLVAALVPRPIPVTGYAIGQPDAESEIENLKSEISHTGAKPTHLAVPAGAVYYFKADSLEDAQKLAAALNWHGGCGSSVPVENRGPGVPPGAEERQAGGSPHHPQAGGMSYTAIRNRRSTLFGEKGFGLGVCGMWAPHPAT